MRWWFVLLIIVGMVFMRNIGDAVQNVRIEEPDHRYEMCAKWLLYNTDRGEIVFHPSWDNFPELFFYNDHNFYLYGLAPDFLYVHNETKYELWDGIRSGIIPQPGKYMREEFYASYVFVDNRYKGFENALNKDQGISMEFVDGNCRIFRIH